MLQPKRPPIFVPSSSTSSLYTWLKHHNSIKFACQPSSKILRFHHPNNKQTTVASSGKNHGETTTFVIGLGGDFRHRMRAQGWPCNQSSATPVLLQVRNEFEAPNINHNFESMSQVQSILGVSLRVLGMNAAIGVKILVFQHQDRAQKHLERVLWLGFEVGFSLPLNY